MEQLLGRKVSSESGFPSTTKKEGRSSRNKKHSKELHAWLKRVGWSLIFFAGVRRTTFISDGFFSGLVVLSFSFLLFYFPSFLPLSLA